MFNVSSLSVESAITLTVDEDVFDHIRICNHGAVARTFPYTWWYLSYFLWRSWEIER